MTIRNYLELDGPFSGILRTKREFAYVVLSVTIVSLALLLIHNRQMIRLQNSKLQSLYAEYNRSHEQWSKLVLELGTLQNKARIEKIAREQLGMIEPPTAEFVG